MDVTALMSIDGVVGERFEIRGDKRMAKIEGGLRREGSFGHFTIGTVST